MLMFYLSQEDQKVRDDPAAAVAYHAGWMAYVSAIRQSGHVRSGAGLLGAATATTVKVEGGKRQVQDGPFADTKEQLGGFFVIDVADLDTALSWAARAPCASTGGVEVRPVMAPPA
jgi:hypothetical protein